MTPELEAWMRQNRQRRILSGVRAQLDRARTRRFKKTQIGLDDLERLLEMASA